MDKKDIGYLEGEVVYFIYKQPIGDIKADFKARGVIHLWRFYKISIDNKNLNGESISLRHIDERSIFYIEKIKQADRTPLQQALLKSLAERRKTLEVKLDIEFEE